MSDLRIIALNYKFKDFFKNLGEPLTISSNEMKTLIDAIKEEWYFQNHFTRW